MKSEHFTLWTDTSAERGRDLVVEMERLRQVIAVAMNHVDSKARALVIALRNDFEVGAYVPDGLAAIAWRPENPSLQPGIILNADFRSRNRLVSHELAHVISYGFIKNQPRWLAEGIASYFETADLDFDATEVKIGMAPEVARFLPRSLRAVQDVFECKGVCSDPRFYATSWAVFVYLVNQRFDDLSRYLQRLNDGAPDQRAAAWRESFPDLTPEVLDQKLPSFLRIGEVALPRIKVTLRGAKTSVRTISDAEVLVARSLLGLIAKKDPAAVRRDAEAALALDRTNLVARLIEAAITKKIAPDDARATAAAHPDDWRAWLLVEDALHGTPEGEQAFAQLCSLAGDGYWKCVARKATAPEEAKR